MTSFSLFLRIVLFLLLPATFSAQRVCLVLSKQAGEAEENATAVLSQYLEQMTGQPVTILRRNQAPEWRPLLYVGANPALKKHGLSVPVRLPDEAVYLQGKNDVFVIAGGGALGPEYAAYALLEQLGCRLYSPGNFHIPHPAPFRFPDLPPRTETPAFAYRELWYEPAFDETWARWHRLKQHSHKKTEWGLFVHTFKDLCPPETYFEAHPEYFSWNGRQRSPGQLCLSNDTVRQIVVAALREKIRANPAAKYWSVSQNDNFDYCRCTGCTASDAYYGSPAGTLLSFVNAVAAEFPDKTISTLAYQYTRRAPRSIRPAPNVSVCLCSIECNRGLPIAEGCPDFARDLAEWAALTDQLMVWDYVVQFRSYVSPFPNWHTLQPNLQLFQKSGVRMMFEQGSGRDKSEFSDMRAYLLAKLLWNPSANMDSILTDFGDGYYGAARPFVWNYIHRLTEAVENGDRQLQIYGIPQDEFFLKQLAANEFTQQIFQATAAMPTDSLLRARVAEGVLLPLSFALYELAKTDSLKFRQIRLQTPEQLSRSLRHFVDAFQTLGIRHLNETGYTPEQYRADYLSFIEKMQRAALSHAVSVHLDGAASPTYAGGRPEVLIDRFVGETDYRYNWLGFQGDDMRAIVRLRDTAVSVVEVSFLQDQQAWVFLPEKVVVEVSADGTHFQLVHEEHLPLTPGAEKTVKTLTATLPAAVGAHVRAVRVTAISAKTCPPWHSCTGQPCWIFADEITVR